MGIENIMPSNRSSNPPCPGKIFAVSFSFAFLFKNEKKKSPNCDMDEIIIAKSIIFISGKKFLKRE